MFEFQYQQGRGRRRLHRVVGDQCQLGSARDNDLMLRSRHLARRHGLLFKTPDGIHVRDLGSGSGTWVNRERVVERGPLQPFDEVRLGDVTLWLVNSTNLTQRVDVAQAGAACEAGEAGGEKPVLSAPAGHNLPTIDSERDYWVSVIHKALLEQMDLRRKDVNRMSDEVLRAESQQLIVTVLEELDEAIPVRLDRAALAATVLDESVGLGPLQRMLDDPGVSEIMVNNHHEVFVERAGRLERAMATFSSDQAVHAVIERIITPLGRRIDESSPIVDARLKDGSRVNAIIPPLALKGPSLTIRKFPEKRLSIADLVQQGSLTEPMVSFLETCVQQRRNMVVSGGTGTGKTTLLNVLSSCIDDRERIVTIEDAAELKLEQPNLVTLEARPHNAEGRGAVSIRDLVRNSLRMRPDRIIVGECRGGEALDMLQAMNTGHDGSLTTLHANSPRDMISRLEVLVLMTGLDLPMLAVREQIAAAIDVVVQLTRFSCGARKVTAISEVTGVESSIVQIQDIFRFQRSGSDEHERTIGHFSATGFVPAFYEELRASGHVLTLDAFQRSDALR